jgi:integrase
MTESHSTPAGTPSKPPKPYPDFPLFPHATKRWAKKIRGQMHYFGPWSDPDAALKKYLAEKDALHAGRKPRTSPDPDAVTVKDVANAFLNAKDALLEAGELSPHTRATYQDAADELVAHMGKARLVSDLGPTDFAGLRNRMARKWGPYRLAVVIQHVRSIFKHAYDAELIDRPVRFGPGFKRPTKRTLRLHRAAKGPKLFTAGEVRRLIEAAGVPYKAMVLLAINCGLGNSDCGSLPLSALDLDGGWLDYPRPKTGVGRRCPLWPETVDALRQALAERHEPEKAEHAGLVFMTRYGRPWAKATPYSPVCQWTRKLVRSLGIGGGKGFYALRHTFRTVADEVKDQPAVDFMMGHEVPHMSAVYRERISDERLRAVAEHVRAWLFGPAPESAARA